MQFVRRGLVVLPNAEIEFTLGAEDRGDVVRPHEFVVQGVNQRDINTCVTQIGLRKRPKEQASMVHWE